MKPGLAVHYAEAPVIGTLLDGAAILGVIGFGAERPDSLPDTCRFVAAPLSAADGKAICEVWIAASPCRPARLGAVSGAYNEDWLFGAVIIDEARGSLAAAAAAAYSEIFAFLRHAKFAAPIRFWNYLCEITAEEHGMERYRQFNIGRDAAFSAHLGASVPPAASCVGGRNGASVICFLAAHEAGHAVENPRQISAYHYPPCHGPRAPRFSRASIHATVGARTMFVSGTASITGHESRHVGDLAGQIDGTIENLRAVFGAAGEAPFGADLSFKIYLHRAEDREAVERALVAAFGAQSRRLFLRADICRRELLVEIEAFASPRA